MNGVENHTEDSIVGAEEVEDSWWGERPGIE